MAIYFKDRIPDPLHGENARYYDAVGDDGTVKLSDFKLILKNNIPIGNTGDPVNADNLNYASGNIVLPVGSPEMIHKGDLLTLTQEGSVIPAKTKRNTAATGLAYATSRLAHGFLRLSDTKLLLLYNDRMVVATVDFNNKTVSFGTYFTAPANVMQSLTLVRSYDEHATAIVCGVDYNDYGPDIVRVYHITNDLISIAGQWTFPLSGVYDSYQSRPVRASSTSVLICQSNNSNVNAYLLNCSSTPPSLITSYSSVATQAQLNGNCRNLFSYDGGNGKCLFVYATASNDVNAVPITVAGNTITPGPVQTLGTTSDTLYMGYYAGVYSGGTNWHTNLSDRVITFGSASGSPLSMQILSIDPSGTVTKGSVINLPILSLTGVNCLTHRSDKIYITGVNLDASLRDSCLLEVMINGLNIQSIKKYLPFHSFKSSSANAIFPAAYENPAKPGEFLFIEEYSSLLPDLTFWFGCQTDCMEANNIIGVALDDVNNASVVTNGYVRLQTSGKYLPGLFNGLQAGLSYMAGYNGGLVPYTGAAGTKPVGIATGVKDLVFFGAVIL